jgi:two-component system KDP operon response regulator KdpE
MTRVLVVDDEPSILRALRINLSAREYDVSTAVDGSSGLAAVARDRPDVIILDLGLPDMDGTEVIHGVRGQPCCPRGGRRARRWPRSTPAPTTT